MHTCSLKEVLTYEEENAGNNVQLTVYIFVDDLL